MDPEKFGAFIQSRRRELGLKQSDIAEKLHVTDKAVSRWERGVGFPDIRLLEPLAQALEISLPELMQSRIMDKDLSRENEQKLLEETAELVEIHRKLSWQRKVVLYAGSGIFLLAALFVFCVVRNMEWEPAWAGSAVSAVAVISLFAGGKMFRYIVKKMYQRGKPWGIWHSIHTWVVFVLGGTGAFVVVNAWRLHTGDPTWFVVAVIIGVGLIISALIYYASHEYDI